MIAITELSKLSSVCALKPRCPNEKAAKVLAGKVTKAESKARKNIEKNEVSILQDW